MPSWPSATQHWVTQALAMVGLFVRWPSRFISSIRILGHVESRPSRKGSSRAVNGCHTPCSTYPSGAMASNAHDSVPHSITMVRCRVASLKPTARNARQDGSCPAVTCLMTCTSSFEAGDDQPSMGQYSPTKECPRLQRQYTRFPNHPCQGLHPRAPLSLYPTPSCTGCLGGHGQVVDHPSQPVT
jgi:hypothetical protein